MYKYIKYFLVYLCISNIYAGSIDYTQCNSVINQVFQHDSAFPYGFIQINKDGEVEPHLCGGTLEKPGCSVVAFNKNEIPETYKVTQPDKIGPKGSLTKIFSVTKNDKLITRISDGDREINLEVIKNKCIVTHVLAIHEKNVREVKFDLLSCKSYYQLQKKFAESLTECAKKDIESYYNKNDLKVIGQSCNKELQVIYEAMVNLKVDFISRYAEDKSLTRKPFEKTHNFLFSIDSFIEEYICSFEYAFSQKDSEKHCTNEHIVKSTTDTALGVFLGNRKSCEVNYPESSFQVKGIFKKKFSYGYKFASKKGNNKTQVIEDKAKKI